MGTKLRWLYTQWRMLILADSTFGCGALGEDTDDIQERAHIHFLYLHLELAAFVGVWGARKSVF